MNEDSMIESPRIAALRQALEAEDTTALDAFWKQIEALRQSSVYHNFDPLQ